MSLTSRVQLHIYLLNVVNQISFSSILQIWYVEVRISWSILESPLEFKITRVNCTILLCLQTHPKWKTLNNDVSIGRDDWHVVYVDMAICLHHLS